MYLPKFATVARIDHDTFAVTLRDSAALKPDVRVYFQVDSDGAGVALDNASYAAGRIGPWMQAVGASFDFPRGLRRTLAAVSRTAPQAGVPLPIEYHPAC